jgi:hypothetical protein
MWVFDSDIFRHIRNGRGVKGAFVLFRVFKMEAPGT